jgi:hypothetical protein
MIDGTLVPSFVVCELASLFLSTCHLVWPPALATIFLPTVPVS